MFSCNYCWSWYVSKLCDLGYVASYYVIGEDRQRFQDIMWDNMWPGIMGLGMACYRVMYGT